MKKPTFVSAGRWHGTANEEGRNEGIILTIGRSPFGIDAMRIELSYEEWGKVLAGIAGRGMEQDR